MVDGAVVLNNDGLHAMKTKTADMDLIAGDHVIVVKFFDNSGGAGIIFKYSGPETSSEEVIVPASVLITPAGVTPPTTTTTTALALSGMVGGLQAEYFYFNAAMQACSL
eukprot:5750018-Amphidinium_carterae.1